MKNFRQAPFLSLFDLKFYREAVQARPRWGFYYLAYLAGVITFLGLLVYYTQMTKFFSWLEKAMPPLAYNSDAGLIMNEPSPYVIKSPKYGKLVTFDMEAQRPTQEQISFSPFFVTARTLYYEKPSGEMGFFDIAKSGSGNGKTVLINDIFKKVRVVAVPILGIPAALLIFVAAFLFKVISGLLFSILGLGINLLRAKKLKYSSVLTVTFFASTAMTFLDILKLTPLGAILTTGFGNYVSIAVTVFYLFLGIKLTEEK